MIMEGGATGEALAGTQRRAFTMPTPPSTNALYKNVRGKGRVKTRQYDDWLMIATTALRQQKIEPFKGRAVAIMGVERTSMNADIDNRIKAAWDAIVKAGVIRDDSLITATAVTWQPAANGLTRIELRSADEPLTVTYHPSQNGASGAWVIDAPTTNEDEIYGDFTG